MAGHDALVKRPFLSAASFSTSIICKSRIGLLPIVLPDDVEFTVRDKVLDMVTESRMEIDRKRQGRKKTIYLTHEALISGPKGNITIDLANFVKVHKENGKILVSIEESENEIQKQMWGTSRGLINNGVIGVSEGHISILKFVGTGYRAALGEDESGSFLSLRVGMCHPVIVRIPQGLKATVPLPHRVIIEGVDKQKVKLLAARIQAFRSPEPYKGKGIFIDNETIKLKQRKIK